MDGVNFNTSHNVFLEYRAASLFDRIIAAIIDIAFIFLYFIIFGIFLTIAASSGESYLYTLFFLPVILYDLLFETFLHGQSIGKYIMKIKVVKTDGTTPSFFNYFIRWILRPVDIWMSSGGIAVLTVFFTGKGQRVGDLAAGTCVISLRDEVTIDDTILTGQSVNYVPEFPAVTNLNDKDIEILKNLLKANSMSEVASNVIEGNYRAKKLIEEKLHIESNMHPLEFIKKIIMDYNYYNSLSD